MTRILWIIGLVIALIAFGGMMTLCLIALVTQKHLNLKGWSMLLVNAYAVWITFGYLRLKVSDGWRKQENSPEGSV